MNIYDELSIFYLKMLKDNPASLSFVLTSEVPVKTFLSLYKTFTKENGLTTIENIPIEKKIELVDECRYTGINFTNETLIASCRVLHTLKFINENS